MLPDQSTIKRLAFIKYLYISGLEQSERPEPLCYAALLSFHDTIELFLHLASEFLDAPQKNRQNFMDYWENISSKLTNGATLTQKASMERLNKARVDLKHYGILPHKSELDSFKTITKIFFEDNTKLVFGIDFLEISLIDLIQCQLAKSDLEEAEGLLIVGKNEDALDKIALSFAKLIDDYENTKIGKYGRSPFFFGESMTFHESFFMSEDLKGFSRRFKGFVDKTKDSLEAIQIALKIISLGIDYRKYVKFSFFTPVVHRSRGGDYEILRVEHGSRGTTTIEDAQFCIDFVIESAIKLQEFDFAVEKESKR